MYKINVFKAVVKKEFILLFRHKLQFFYEIILPVVKIIPTILFGIFLVNSVGTNKFNDITGNGNVIAYISLSIIFSIFIDVQEQIGYYLENEMWMGTLEQIWLTIVNKYFLFICLIIYTTVKSIIYSLISFSFMMLAIKLGTGNYVISIKIHIILFTILFCILILVSVNIGIIISGITLRYRQSDSIVYFITLIVPILSGITYPIIVLPVYIRWISYILPTTFVYDLLRYSLLRTNTIFYIHTEMIILILELILYSILSFKIFIKIVERVKKCGTIYLK